MSEDVEKLYDGAGLGWLRYKTAKGKTIDSMTLQETAEYIVDLENALSQPIILGVPNIEDETCRHCNHVTKAGEHHSHPCAADSGHPDDALSQPSVKQRGSMTVAGVVCHDLVHRETVSQPSDEELNNQLEELRKKYPPVSPEEIRARNAYVTAKHYPYQNHLCLSQPSVTVEELAKFVRDTVADTPSRDGGFTDYETIGAHTAQAILARYNVTVKG